MAKSVEFKVARPHLGDKPYKKGDVRVADPRHVRHLVSSGVLVAQDEKEVVEKTASKGKENKRKGAGGKAAPGAENKAEPGAATKADATEPDAVNEGAESAKSGS